MARWTRVFTPELKDPWFQSGHNLWHCEKGTFEYVHRSILGIFE